jgi:hypothetical protein
VCTTWYSGWSWRHFLDRRRELCIHTCGFRATLASGLRKAVWLASMGTLVYACVRYSFMQANRGSIHLLVYLAHTLNILAIVRLIELGLPGSNSNIPRCIPQNHHNPSRFILTNNQSRNSSLLQRHSLASGSSPAGVVIQTPLHPDSRGYVCFP